MLSPVTLRCAEDVSKDDGPYLDTAGAVSFEARHSASQTRVNALKARASG